MKKRIAHLTFDMSIGGAERVIYNLVKSTDRSKYDLSILCLEEPIGPLGKQLQEEGYSISSLGRKPGFDLSLLRKVRQYIKHHQVDLLHCHQYTPFVYGVLSAALTKVKVIFTEHGRFYPDERRMKRVLLNPLLSLFTDHITAISRATCNALVNFENFSPQKIEVIYNGIQGPKCLQAGNSEMLKRSLGIHPDAHVLGAVARLDPIKNLKMMIRAFSIVKKTYPDTFLMVIGDGPEREDLKSLGHTLRLSPHIIYTGFKDDVYPYLEIMDIFLLSSFSEGTAMTLLEAMAFGLPCIATRVGGNPEIVTDNKTGFLIPNNDEASLAERIVLLLQDENLREKMGRAARERFEENFTVNKMVREYEKIYDELIVNGKR